MPRGRRRTQYVRDAQGQFASTPGGGKKATPASVRKAAKAATLKKGTLAARTSLKRSRSKLATFDKADQTLQATLSKRSQKGAVTRGNKKALQAQKESKRTLPRVASGKSILKKTKPKQESNQQNNPKASRIKKEQRKLGSKTGRKIDVQIKRAAIGGEYGSDGHFYPAGAWMPAGKFQGGKQQSFFGNGTTRSGDGNNTGNVTQVKIIRQRQPDPPIVRPSGKSIDAPQNISTKGKRNRDTLFGDMGYISVKKNRIGGSEIVIPGFVTKGGSLGPLQTAAIASRMTMKQMGKAILKLRNMSKNKKKFDDNMNYDFNSYSNKRIAQERRKQDESGMVGYADIKKQGYLPRDATIQSWRRANQFTDAVWTIATERSSRTGNRRDSVEEFAWVMNNVIGKRDSRKPSMVLTNNKSTRIRLPKIKSTIRPISTKKLIAAGGNRWQKGPHDRIYFNNETGAKIFYDRNTRKMNVQSSILNPKANRIASSMKKTGRLQPVHWPRGRKIKPNT